MGEHKTNKTKHKHKAKHSGHKNAANVSITNKSTVLSTVTEHNNPHVSGSNSSSQSQVEGNIKASKATKHMSSDKHSEPQKLGNAPEAKDGMASGKAASGTLADNTLTH